MIAIIRNSRNLHLFQILELVELSKQLDSSLKFIVITSKKNCQLAKLADVVLTTGAPEEVCALGLAPTTVMNVIGDILVVETMEKIGFTIEQYNKRHHGGYLGQRSKKLL